MMTNKQVNNMLDVIAKYIDPKKIDAVCDLEYIPYYMATSRTVTVKINGMDYQNYSLFENDPGHDVTVDVIADLLKCAFITKNKRKRNGIKTSI